MCQIQGLRRPLFHGNFYHDHLAKKVGTLDDVGKFIRLLDANSLEIPVDGYLETTLEIFGQKLYASFLVSSKNTPSLR